eukprot:gene1961-2406_t
MEILWLIPLTIASVLWAGCDVISDGVISEDHVPPTRKNDDDDVYIDHPQQQQQHQHRDTDIEMRFTDSISTSTATTTATVTYQESKLTGEQDSIISAIVMLFCGVFLHLYLGDSKVYGFYDTYQQEILNANINNDDTSVMVTRIHPDIVFWAAMISGIFQCFSLIYLLKSFESLSSTTIVPLMQLNSVFVLPLSIILSFLSIRYPILSTFHKIITPLHLFAFILIFLGSFYPSLEGDWMQLTRSSFWKQKAVVQVLLSDFLIAIYYLVVSFCTNSTGGMTSPSFLVISIYGNCMTFLFLVVFIKKFRQSAVSILMISRKYVLLSALGELFSLSGYFFVSISYHLYYNSGIVSATEGALNQLFNLLVAIFLKKFINFGRDVKRIREKLFSVLIVSIGLLLTSSSH